MEQCKPFFHPRPLFDVEAVKGNPRTSARRSRRRSAFGLAETEHAGGRHQGRRRRVLQHRLGKLWIKNNDKFNSGEPGIGLEVAKWCIDKGVCMTGADTWATEVVPNPNKDLAFPVPSGADHQERHLQPRESRLHGLIADRKYQFAYIFSPAADQRCHGIEWRADRVT